MKVKVSGAGAVQLDEPEVFDDLRVVIDADADAAAAALAPYGEITDDGAHVNLEPGALPQLAARLGDDPGWRERYDGMVGYAKSQGWVDERGRVRAHVERA